VRAVWFGLVVFALALASCSEDDEDPKRSGSGGSAGVTQDGSAGSSSGGADASVGGFAGSAGSGGTAGVAGADSGLGGSSGAGPFALSSPAFPEGGTIPETYECTAADSGALNVSPPLAWTPGPDGTESYALVLRDLDFGNGFIQWVIWDIPKSTVSLPEGVEHIYQPSTPAGAKQTIFQGAVYGYFGPCSPGVNTYEFTIYALPMATLPGVDQNSTKQEVAALLVAEAIGSTILTGKS
jgi:Raf kinase inhibitor-like YbhB/YbcL family protein